MHVVDYLCTNTASLIKSEALLLFLQCVSKNGSPKSWSASIDSTAFLTYRSVTNHTCTLFESSRLKDSNELLFAVRGEHLSLLGQLKEKSHVLKSSNYKHKALRV